MPFFIQWHSFAIDYCGPFPPAGAGAAPGAGGKPALTLTNSTSKSVIPYMASNDRVDLAITGFSSFDNFVGKIFYCDFALTTDIKNFPDALFIF